MFFKLAVNNVKKSMKDYTIYFLTLLFGVCLFYVFNSIHSQQEMLDLSKQQRDILEAFIDVLGGVSVFISVILGFLIIYANKFLIKRRKKELGLYLTLGMERSKISRILMLETLIIGIFALGFGMIAGIFASQGLSVVTAKLMETSISRFRFIFSVDAFMKAILYFGIIFLIVMIFNTIMISKCKLIDLLQGSKKNENLRIKKLGVSVVLFLISVFCLGLAYYFIQKNGMRVVDKVFIAAIVFGIIGTLLFFMSLSGFMLRVIKSNRTIYYHGLNMFILRQINSKINTAYISMTFICLMLLITIGTLSSGMGVAKALTGRLNQTTPYDATLQITGNDGNEMERADEKISYIKNKYAKAVKEQEEIKIYYSEEIDFGLLLDRNKIERSASMTYSEIMQDMEGEAVSIIGITDYNNARLQQGKEKMTLGENEFILNCTVDQMKPFLNRTGKEWSLMLGGVKYQASNQPMQSFCYETSAMMTDLGSVIVPDTALSGLNPNRVLINMNYIKSNHKYEDMVQDYTRDTEEIKEIRYSIFTKIRAFDQGFGIRTVVAYFVLYIGIVFLITSAAVLAIQQLSESSDNIERYRLLRKIGVEKSMMNRSVFVQIFIYFMMPLFLALIHSIVGIKVANNIIETLGSMNVLDNIVFTGLIVLIIYGGYFIATYIGSKNIIKEKN